MSGLLAIQRVELIVDTGLDLVDIQFGAENVYKFGYCWFYYAGAQGDPNSYIGKLHFLNFVNNVIFPEGVGAFQFGWQLRPGCSAHARAHYQAGPALVQVAGNTLNPLFGQLVNFTT